MIEQNFYNDEFAYITTDVSTVNTWEANANEENRQKWVTDLAAISRGKTESKNPAKRYAQLLKEAAPNKCNPDCSGVPSRPLEFLPVVVGVKYINDNVALYNINTRDIFYTMDITSFLNNLMPFSYLQENDVASDYTMYTNMRALINAQVPYDTIPYNKPEDIKRGKFFAIRLNLPMFVWAQLNTHTQISKEAKSDRVTDLNLYDFWLPNDIIERVIVFLNDQATEHKYQAAKELKELIEETQDIAVVRDLFANLSPGETAYVFKSMGYPKEIINRAIYYFRYKEFVMVGWGIDPKKWNHLFLERNATDQWSNWTQEQTKIAVKVIKKLYDVMYPKEEV